MDNCAQHGSWCLQVNGLEGFIHANKLSWTPGCEQEGLQVDGTSGISRYLLNSSCAYKWQCHPQKSQWAVSNKLCSPLWNWCNQSVTSRCNCTIPNMNLAPNCYIPYFKFLAVSWCVPCPSFQILATTVFLKHTSFASTGFCSLHTSWQHLCMTTPHKNRVTIYHTWLLKEIRFVLESQRAHWTFSRIQAHSPVQDSCALSCR
jgi:hypothetical protein